MIHGRVRTGIRIHVESAEDVAIMVGEFRCESFLDDGREHRSPVEGGKGPLDLRVAGDLNGSPMTEWIAMRTGFSPGDVDRPRVQSDVQSRCGHLRGDIAVIPLQMP